MVLYGLLGYWIPLSVIRCLSCSPMFILHVLLYMVFILGHLIYGIICIIGHLIYYIVCCDTGSHYRSFDIFIVC